MTSQSGQPVTDRTEEIEEYVAQVREALADLPPAQRSEVLEDLPAHLAEVAAEDPAPLSQRLGPPAEYAAELRAALHPSAGEGRLSWRSRLRARGEQVAAQLRRLDVQAGPLIGYERLSDFLRLLRPAWWVLRGYLAAMLVVLLLNQQGSVGLLPRLGGSTIAGLVILAGFVAGSIWLAHRGDRLRRWQRRAVQITSAVLVLFGLAGLIGVDENQRWGWPGAPIYVSEDPYGHVDDVFVVDGEGNLLTGVALFDQDGNPIDIGNTWCSDTAEYEQDGRYVIRYPRCPDNLPWWLNPMFQREGETAVASPTPLPTPDAPASPVDPTEPGGPADPSPTPAPTPEVSTPSPAPADEPDR
ncbi:MAG TPA: hypothetical protein VKZ74_01420 [Natronosporangium sp.]|nr:hypothetical protein [Natronosporangium sp.]